MTKPQATAIIILLIMILAALAYIFFKMHEMQEKDRLLEINIRAVGESI